MYLEKDMVQEMEPPVMEFVVNGMTARSSSLSPPDSPEPEPEVVGVTGHVRNMIQLFGSMANGQYTFTTGQSVPVTIQYMLSKQSLLQSQATLVVVHVPVHSCRFIINKYFKRHTMWT